MTSNKIAFNNVHDEAFAEFYTAEHEGQVRRAFLLLGDAAAAHDVVANAFIAVYQRWQTVDSPGPYLNRCVLNGCRDVGRRSKRDATAPESKIEIAAPNQDNDPTGALADGLGRLPFRQRAAIVLRYYGGFSEAEIAEQLGCRPGTVGSLIHRALVNLRDHLSLGKES